MNIHKRGTYNRRGAECSAMLSDESRLSDSWDEVDCGGCLAMREEVEIRRRMILEELLPDKFRRKKFR